MDYESILNAIEILENSDKNAEEFNYFKDILTVVKIVKVVDGDTVHANFCPQIIRNCPACNYEQNKNCKDIDIKRIIIRFDIINTYELRSKDKTEKKLAILAKELLELLISNNLCYIKTNGVGNFGRILATIYASVTSVDEILKKYDIDMTDYNYGKLSIEEIFKKNQEFIVNENYIL